MKLDGFDSHVLAQSGDAQEIMRDIYGDDIGKNNAEKQLAGIRKHLAYKRGASGDNELPVHRKYKLEPSGVQVRDYGSEVPLPVSGAGNRCDPSRHIH